MNAAHTWVARIDGAGVAVVAVDGKFDAAPPRVAKYFLTNTGSTAKIVDRRVDALAPRTGIKRAVDAVVAVNVRCAGRSRRWRRPAAFTFDTKLTSRAAGTRATPGGALLAGATLPPCGVFGSARAGASVAWFATKCPAWAAGLRRIRDAVLGDRPGRADSEGQAYCAKQAAARASVSYGAGKGIEALGAHGRTSGWGRTSAWGRSSRGAQHDGRRENGKEAGIPAWIHPASILRRAGVYLPLRSSKDRKPTCLVRPLHARWGAAPSHRS